MAKKTKQTALLNGSNMSNLLYALPTVKKKLKNLQIENVKTYLKMSYQ